MVGCAGSIPSRHVPRWEFRVYEKCGIQGHASDKPRSHNENLYTLHFHLFDNKFLLMENRIRIEFLPLSLQGRMLRSPAAACESWYWVKMPPGWAGAVPVSDFLASPRVRVNQRGSQAHSHLFSALSSASVIPLSFLCKLDQAKGTVFRSAIPVFVAMYLELSLKLSGLERDLGFWKKIRPCLISSPLSNWAHCHLSPATTLQTMSPADIL